MVRCICHPVTISLLSVLYLVKGKELYETETDYNKNVPPGANHTEVSVSLFINRVSAVDENKEEITLDLFMQVYWQDARVKISNASNMSLEVIELTWQEQQNFWVPDLYIRQLREMKVLSLFQEMTSVRLYKNQTMRVSIGATVIIKCDMDFVLYPLDIQKCAVDFSSYKYTMNEMTFRWRDDPPLSFPSDFGDDGFRLAKYVVSFTTEKDMHVVFYGEGNHSTARMLITMEREIRSHLLESYLPSTLFVIMSWGSFVVIPEVVPGRMVLLVTTLLSLVTMFDTVRNNSPNALELKCIEVWLISCTLFVFFALLEYFVVLFGIRYEKHWRHKKRDLEKLNTNLGAGGPAGSHSPAPGTIQHISQLPPLLQHRRTGSHATTNNVSVLQDRNGGGGGGGGGREGGTGGGRSEGLRSLGTSKVSPRRDDPVMTSVPHADTTDGSEEEFVGRKRFRMVAEYVILYCGSQRGMLDQVSLALFPISFLLFTSVYWISYLTESQRQRNN